MQDQQGGADPAAPQAAVPGRTVAAARCPDCALCARWEPGPVVLRGNSLGVCAVLELATPADFGCDSHVAAPLRRVRRA